MAATQQAAVMAGEVIMDGRRARSERTKRQLAEAFLALINEGDLRPTAHRIAQRAKVSLRMVFHHFKDLESMFALAAATQTARLMSTVHPISPSGPLPDRIRKFVIQRSNLLEQMTPVRRSALLVEPFSPAVALRVDDVRKWKRNAVLSTFDPEISALPEATRTQGASALAASASFSSWDALRRQQRLSVLEARHALTHTMARLLELENESAAHDGLGDDLKNG